MPDVRQTAFDIIHRLRSAGTQRAVYAELRRTGTIFGYDAFLIGGLPHSPSENLSDCSLISGWPPGWTQRYEERNHLHRDPVIRYIRATTDPFLWHEAAAHGDPRGSVVMNEAREFGLKEGFCVPFHELDGSEAGVSFGGTEVRLSEDARAGLHLVAIYAMSRAKAIARRVQEGDAAEGAAVGLTGREIECLKWAAAGKTAWETSVILSISARTVEHYLACAARKLGATSRVQSVAEALRQRIID
ncbi:HTH-type quorum sensing-dependent transcriptional regulator RpaR [Methylobacterium adhaesivum]|uniref:LuxR family transcriptional regulator n=1 Tax=Methylobacterium adhaesivum TaxID=333297 RepID=A0ABT8BG79_9HYPH|nr:LuxR family transcriptional regulator [Methylobacterium adhaesivum]MDN3590229.1 LuxR family transcriptional regulator [Methylobacterium adhaesivum]GJD31084.1 HTH-type quorum sensing-dependent transcriptional regulator RpaR [Methylobacterium adhaesivum]